METRNRCQRFTRFSVLLLITLATLATFAGEAAAILHRVGPINSDNSVGNYPAWYQDNTGITLEFCDPKNDNELDGGWCLLARDAVGAPGVVSVPEFFPTNFVDEHFYYAADANALDNTNNSPLGRAILVLAVEAAFAADVAPGGQIVFARIRVRIDDPPPGTYRIIHPYGEEAAVVAPGDTRIFITDDVGIACTPGDFSCALNSRLGPFLLPSNTPGGAELPAIAGPAPGKLYIADPGRSGPVTGSPTGNNFFRVEGPAGSNIGGPGIDSIQTNNFTLVGRLFTGNIPGEVTVDRAEYARNSGGQKVEVYATGLETTQGRIPAQPPAPSILPVLSFFDAPCASAFDNNLNPIPPFSAPAGAVETPMFNTGNSFWAFVPVDPIPTALCVKDSVSNAFYLKSVVDEIIITQAYFDPNAQSLSVGAFSSDEIDPPLLSLGALGDLTNGSILVSPLAAPPSHVHVNSSHGGINLLQVTTTPPAASAPPPVAGVTLVASPADNTQTGNNVTFTAAATGGSGDYRYQFLAKPATSDTFSIPQLYGVDNSWTWNTIGSPPGVYEIQVYARSFGSVAPLEALGTLVYTLTVPPVSGGTLTASPDNTTAESGSTVTFTATASGGSGNYEYEFQARVAGGTFVTPAPYGPSNAWPWDTTGSPAGGYEVKVNIRNVGSTAPSEFTASIPSYVLTANTSAAPSAVTLAANPVDNAATGGTVVYTATVIGGTGPFEYQFLARVAGGAFVVPQPYGALNSWTWDTTGSPPQSYEVMVMVRREKSAVPFEVTSTIPYVLTP